MNISKMRECAFKLVYEIEVQKEFNEELVTLYLDNNEITDKNARKYVRKLVRGIQSNDSEIENFKGKYSYFKNSNLWNTLCRCTI